MGWWIQNPEGHSLQCEGDLKWGDGPADIMGPALDQIFAEFREAYGRDPVEAELKAGIMFSARPMLEPVRERSRG